MKISDFFVNLDQGSQAQTSSADKGKGKGDFPTRFMQLLFDEQRSTGKGEGSAKVAWGLSEGNLESDGPFSAADRFLSESRLNLPHQLNSEGGSEDTSHPADTGEEPIDNLSLADEEGGAELQDPAGAARNLHEGGVESADKGESSEQAPVSSESGDRSQSPIEEGSENWIEPVPQEDLETPRSPVDPAFLESDNAEPQVAGRIDPDGSGGSPDPTLNRSLGSRGADGSESRASENVDTPFPLAHEGAGGRGPRSNAMSEASRESARFHRAATAPSLDDGSPGTKLAGFEISSALSSGSAGETASSPRSEGADSRVDAESGGDEQQFRNMKFESKLPPDAEVGQQRSQGGESRAINVGPSDFRRSDGSTPQDSKISPNGPVESAEAEASHLRPGESSRVEKHRQERGAADRLPRSERIPDGETLPPREMPRQVIERLEAGETNAENPAGSAQRSAKFGRERSDAPPSFAAAEEIEQARSRQQLVDRTSFSKSAGSSDFGSSFDRSAGSEGNADGQTDTGHQTERLFMQNSQTAGGTAQGSGSDDLFSEMLHRTATRDLTTEASSDSAANQPSAARAAGETASPARQLGQEQALDMFRQIVSRIRLEKMEPGFRMEIRLKPEWLGRIRIETVIDGDDRLKAVIHAADPAVKKALEVHLPELMDQLQKVDVRLEQAEIRNMFAQSDSQSQSRNRAAGQSGSSHSPEQSNDESKQASSTSEERRDGIQKDGSVSYFA